VPLYLFGVALVALVAISASGAWAQRRRRRAGVSVPIRSIVESGPARVRGEVTCAAPLLAPLTGRRCAYVRIEFHCESMGRIHRYAWSERRDFSIADASGHAQVLVERAEFEVVADIIQMGRVADLTAAQRATIAQFQWSLPPIGPIELCEAVVEVGATIEVAGVAANDIDPTPANGARGYRDGPAMTPIFQRDVFISDGRRDRVWIAPSSGG